MLTLDLNPKSRPAYSLAETPQAATQTAPATQAASNQEGCLFSAVSLLAGIASSEVPHPYMLCQPIRLA